MPFFQNITGGGLGPNVRTRGNLWSTFSTVTGTVNASPNTIRRGLETEVQKRPALAARSRDIQGHSLEVGDSIYNRCGDQIRAPVIFKLNSEEAGQGEDDVPPVKKTKFDDEDEMMRKKIAQEKLSETGRKFTLGRNCRVLPQDRLMIQNFFSNPDNFSVTKLDPSVKFPG